MSDGPRECDVLVVGSGAAGLCAAWTAALGGARVICAERAPVLGGTTAWSGGWMWLPRNRHARAAGINEPLSAPRDYLAAVLGNRFDAPRVERFLEAAPAMVDDLTAHGMVFEPGNAICDIYGALPGAGTGGRSLIAAPFDARVLGPRIAMLRKTKRETAFLGMPIQAGPDLKAFLNATRSPRAFLHVARRLARHMAELATHRRAMHLVNGVGLVARLFALADARGVEWWTGTRVDGLLRDGSGRITGATVSGAAFTGEVRARHGVILATGGFSASAARRAELFPHAGQHRTLAVPEADGAGLALAQAVGAAADMATTAAGAWCPVSEVTWADGTKGVFPHIIDRGKPGAIAVAADGQRFVNEADGYHDYVRALLARTPAHRPARSWLVCDHDFIRRWGLGIVRPAPLPMRHWLKTGYLRRAATLEALALRCGIAPDGLAATVAACNADAATGTDRAFGRGATPYNRNQGDPARKPNPNLAPIARAPFYAVEVVPGSFGSFAGIAVDAEARVLDAVGATIPGLWAAGADAASVMGGHYPAGGINLGPAMVLGWLAARDALAGRQ